MKTKKILITLLMALFISHSSFSQVGSSQVELDEIVLSVPFSQTIGGYYGGNFTLLCTLFYFTIVTSNCFGSG